MEHGAIYPDSGETHDWINTSSTGRLTSAEALPAAATHQGAAPRLLLGSSIRSAFASSLYW
jgi:hypothetical protein